jgi:hypothetical protein
MSKQRNAPTKKTYRVHIQLSMSPARTNYFSLDGPHTSAGAMALINMGLELLLFLSRHDPVALARAIAAVRGMAGGFEDAARDQTRECVVVLVHDGQV